MAGSYRVSVDPDRCEGHSLCEGIAPDLFEVGDDEVSRLRRAPTSDDWPKLEEAIRRCPKQAITMSDLQRD